MRYQFPKKLDTNISPFIKFSSFKWTVRGKKSQSIKAIRSSVDTIVLPISQNGLQSNITANWSEENFLDNKNFLEGLKNRLNVASRQKINQLDKYFYLQQGVAINDFASLLFQGTNLREFSFTYSLIPESEKESNLIADIVKAFKRNCLPEYQGWKILYPNFWKISLVLPGKDQKLFKFKDCVMTSLQDSYFTENQYTFTDGSPVKINFDMSFRELDKIDRKEYK